MLSRKSVRNALQDWKRTEALGQHPLADLPIVAARRVAAGYPDTPIGRGKALRDVLRGAIETLRPDSGPPNLADDRWRPFMILTEQYIEGEAPGYVAGKLSIALRTYHHWQRQALDTLAAILREQEESAAVIDQGIPDPTAASEVLPLGDVNTQDEASEAADQDAAASEAARRMWSQAAPRPHQPEPGQAQPISRMLNWRLAVPVILLGGLVWVILRQSIADPQPVLATIAFGDNRTTYIGANPVTQRVYVGAEDVPGIAVIDAVTNAVLTTIPTEGYHIGIAVNPATNRVYVAQQFAGSVRIIDGADNSVLGDLVVPGLVQTIGDLALNSVTNRLYVIRANNNDVAVFDTTTNVFVDAIAFDPPSAPGCPIIPCDATGIAVNPASNRIYLAHSASARLTVIDGASNRVITSVPVGKGASRIAINPVTNRIYVTNSGEGSLSVIDGASQRVVATIPVEMGPIGVVVNPNTNRIYVANGESKTVSVIDGASNLIVATVPLGVPANLTALIPSNSRIYVTSDAAHNVKVIEDVAPPFVAWVPLETTGGPPTARGDTAHRPLGYDPTSNRMLFFGGMKQGGTLLNDTWVLADADGTTGAPQWIELATANTPPPRRGHAGAYDTASNRLITYGGCLGGCTPLDNKVYVLSNANGLGGASSWQELPVSGPPPPRDGHSAVYDPTSNRLIVFGGDDCCGQRYNDTWVLTNANGLGGPPAWLQLTPIGGPPPGRAGHSAVYDAANNRMIVFGGAAVSGVLNDAWVLAGANGLAGAPTWSQLAPTGALPAARGGYSAVYDPGAGQMLIFGGNDGTSLRNDTWVLTHANGLGGTPAWTKIIPFGTPPPSRTSSNAVYRSATNRLVIFGGDTLAGPLNDTWTLVNAIPPER